MADRDIDIILMEILETIDQIKLALHGQTFESFSANWLLKHGVQRGIEIISEAARHLPDDVIDASPEVPWKQVKGVGNVLRHEYHRISDRIIWNVAIGHLDVLRRAMEQFLTEDRT